MGWKEQQMQYKIAVTRAEQVNMSMQPVRFEIQGTFVMGVYSVEWRTVVFPQAESWDFMWWEFDGDYDKDLDFPYYNEFRAAVADLMWQIEGSYNRAVKRVLAGLTEPALGADTQMTTDEVTS